jgi:exopolysaccharide biosynthesis polyprenyl glycosylphosphotransferase
VPKYSRPNRSDGKGYALKLFKLLYIAVCTALFWGFYYFVVSRYGDESHFDHPKANILFVILYIAGLIWFIRVYNGFYFGASRVTELAFSLSIATSINSFCMYIVLCIYLNRFLNIGYFFLSCLSYIPFNLIFSRLGNKLYFHNNFPRKTLIVYRSRSDLEKLDDIKSLKRNFNVVNCIENPKSAEELYPELDSCDVVFVAGIYPKIRNEIAKHCIQEGITAYIEPQIGDIIMAGGSYVSKFSLPILRVGCACPDPEFLFIKRLADIVVSLIAIIILSPLMLVSAVFIKAYDRGPVLYKQVRLTRGGKKFEILKFRSMRVDAEKDGVARLAKDNDDRITPVGRIIRACRMDELPQLFNVLKGDMSIVGPRPERPEIAEQYKESIPSFDLRLQVKAGLTGFAQVYGKYNTEPYDKLQMDLMYINNMSVLNDLWLMLATVKVLFQKESTSGIASDQVTAERHSSPEQTDNN